MNGAAQKLGIGLAGHRRQFIAALGRGAFLCSSTMRRVCLFRTRFAKKHPLLHIREAFGNRQSANFRFDSALIPLSYPYSAFYTEA
jgi:hypothetical protein